MQLFLSYAQANKSVASEIDMALRTEGYIVFFDRLSLPVGDGFHRLIREQLKISDKMVFLVSPASVRHGSYALTELKFAQDKWLNPSGRVLPVIVEPTPMADVPPYLRSVTILDPVGNVAAEVVDAISRMAEPYKFGTSTPAVRVLTHLACFINEPDRPALFINVLNILSDREVEVTHVWIETIPRTYALPNTRPLPIRLRSFESWETWVYIDQIVSIPAGNLYNLARVRLSSGEVLNSRENLEVPEVGYVPGSKSQ